MPSAIAIFLNQLKVFFIPQTPKGAFKFPCFEIALLNRKARKD